MNAMRSTVYICPYDCSRRRKVAGDEDDSDRARRRLICSVQRSSILYCARAIRVYVRICTTVVYCLPIPILYHSTHTVYAAT